MYIKKPVLFGFMIAFLALFIVGEYFYLMNKYSPTRVIVNPNISVTPVSKEKNAVIQIELTPTPTTGDVIGISTEITVSPTITPELTIQQVQNYLNSLLSYKTSWQNNKDKISAEDFNFLMDSFERQISFCQTIIEHLNQDPNPSEADLVLWDGVQKMWAETGEITSKLNEQLSK